MATTHKQNLDFVATVLDTDSLLDAAVEWIENTLCPEDVFDDAVLTDWARENRGKLDAFPEDLFDDQDLVEWAESKGYVLADE